LTALLKLATMLESKSRKKLSFLAKMESVIMANTTVAEYEKAIKDVKGCSRMEDLTWPLAVIFLLVGIIADLFNITLGLETIHWFLLVIAALLVAIFFRLGRGIYWYLNNSK
jgi:hypothetical protein